MYRISLIQKPVCWSFRDMVQPEIIQFRMLHHGMMLHHGIMNRSI